MRNELIAVVTLSLAFTGCLSEEEAAQNEAEMELGTVQQAITVGKTYVWSQYLGSNDTVMESKDTSFCFLTFITGKFEGAGESVRVMTVDGKWVLRGSSAQRGVVAHARCVPAGRHGGRRYTYTDTKRWDQFKPNVFHGPTSDRVCFLMGVQGNFDGAGERVEVRPTQAGWYLGGGSGSVSNAISGWSACLVNVDGIQAGPYSWAQGAPTVNTGLFAESWACGLSKMQGRFDGTNEYLHATQTPRAGGGYQWALTGGSQQHGVAGAMTCAF